MLLMAITSIPRLISFFSFYSEREPREQLSTTQKSLTPCVWTWDKQGNWKNPPIPVHSVNTVWLHCLIVLQSPSYIKTGVSTRSTRRLTDTQIPDVVFTRIGNSKWHGTISGWLYFKESRKTTGAPGGPKLLLCQWSLYDGRIFGNDNLVMTI